MCEHIVPIWSIDLQICHTLELLVLNEIVPTPNETPFKKIIKDSDLFS
jgi:hypothetical protein